MKIVNIIRGNNQSWQAETNWIDFITLGHSLQVLPCFNVSCPAVIVYPEFRPRVRNWFTVVGVNWSRPYSYTLRNSIRVKTQCNIRRKQENVFFCVKLDFWKVICICLHFSNTRSFSGQRVCGHIFTRICWHHGENDIYSYRSIRQKKYINCIIHTCAATSASGAGPNHCNKIVKDSKDVLRWRP